MMMQQVRMLGLAGFALLLAGCASPSTTHMIGQARAPVAPESVLVYVQEPEHYQAIALLTATSDGSWSLGDEAKMNAVLQRLKEAAAKVGANGVLLKATGERRDDSVHVGTGIGRYGGNVGIGLNIGKSFGLTDKTAEGVAIWVEP
ncbi:hypothetical protein [Pseudidiomarina sediminum]|nr:hypothetical protein [Pseudidiomarina sediminum]